MKRLSLILFIALCVIKQSYALQISEIMYDPSGSDTGHEWIEIYNDGEAAVDVKTLKLYENNTNHSITYVSGNEMLQKGEYAVIADNASFFSIDNPSFTGNLFDSAFSISNSGEALEMRSSSLEPLNKVTYTPITESNGTGATISLINNVWVKSNSTPGAANAELTTSVIPGGSPTSSTSSTSNLTSSYVQTTKRTYLLGDIHMLTNKEIFTVAGANAYFETRNSDSRNNNITGTVYWSYGDGAGGVGATTTHVYQYSGDYNAFLEVENSSVYGIESIKVHVRDPRLLVHATATGVAIKNLDDEDIDIGGFSIMCDTGIFQIARHLLLNKNATVVINDKVLGFVCKNPKLRFPNTVLVPVVDNEYKNENKSLLTYSTSSQKLDTQLKKPLLYKPKTQYYSAKVKMESNKATTSTQHSTSSSMGKTNNSKINKWLYWLYE